MAQEQQRSIYAWPAKEQRRTIGRRIPRIDGPNKTTGRAKYTYDINLPGMLHAKLLTSPHAHATITKLDVEPARQVQGVRGVYLFDDGKVGATLQYDGQPIAAVAAETEEQAEDGVRAIQIEYDVLPHFVDEDDLEGARNEGRAEEGEEDIAGDPDAAFAEADAVIEGYYGIPTITHCCWESHGAACQWEDERTLKVWLSTQNVSFTAAQFTQGLSGKGIATDSAEVICEYEGGGFGSKFSPDSWGIAAAALAHETGQPVKLMLDRATELKTAGNRPSGFAKVKVGAKTDGTLVAWESHHWGSRGIGGGTVDLRVVPYIFDIPNRRRKQTGIRVNGGSYRAWRAPNHPQGCLLTQTALDDMAAELGMDSLEFFRKNLPLATAVAHPDGPGIYAKELEIAAELMGWKEKWHPRGRGGSGAVKRGLGLALHTWGGGAHASNCRLVIHPDGGVETFLGSQDLGTGTRTVIAAVVAETLGLPVEAVKVHIGRSSYPASGPSGGSTTVGGVSGSNRKAAMDARNQLFAVVAKKLQANPEELEAVDGRIRVTGDPDRSLSWKQAAALLGVRPLEVEAQHSGAEPGLTSNGVGGVQMADVSVDTETGVVRINKHVAVQDCGTLINLRTAESQVYGGVIMAIAYALSEEVILDNATGRFINANLADYKLPRLADVGTIIVHMIQPEDGEVGQQEDARGVIGLGEPPVISGGAAISNAVANAIGVRVPTLPFTPDKVLAALGHA